MARRGGARRGGGGTRGGRTSHRSGASTNQEIEGSVHTTHIETEEFTRLLKETLLIILDEALRKAKENPNTTLVNEGPVVLPTMGGPIPVENVAPPTRDCDYKAFRGCDPPVLTRCEEAADTLDWINGMESTIRLSECRPEQAVMFAAKSLKGETSHWWETVKQAKGDQAIDLMRWNDLKALVTEKFCPKKEVHKVEREFLTLQAGLMTHRQYTSKYIELACLVPHLVTTEERRIHYYVQGLPPKIRTFVKANTPRYPSRKQTVKRTSEDLQVPGERRARVKVAAYVASVERDTEVNVELGHLSRDCRKPKEPEAGGSGKGKGAEKEPYVNKAKARAYQITQ
ncbi:hypothetical protein L1987_46571 [Smallanthus sonchifolius]|uniref:Uncharacterized protein n=1 Tax=Smallanthus sonchifolius TaxID=185202 RepID=A0ACB9G0P2_9ASTR|nr:hypothetical protein L1987_46571 [Smallanthus sonchifolius]